MKFSRLAPVGLQRRSALAGGIMVFPELLIEVSMVPMLEVAAVRILAALFLVLGSAGAAETRNIGIAVGDFAYVDSSGETADQVAVHTEQLRGFVAALRQDFERHGGYHLVPLSCGTSCMDVELPDLARMASGAGANIVIIGGIHKMSTLVQWARVEAINVNTNRVVLDKLFTFRGDNAQAWDRAEAFVFRELLAGLAKVGS